MERFPSYIPSHSVWGLVRVGLLCDRFSYRVGLGYRVGLSLVDGDWVLDLLGDRVRNRVGLSLRNGDGVLDLLGDGVGFGDSLRLLDGDRVFDRFGDRVRHRHRLGNLSVTVIARNGENHRHGKEGRDESEALHFAGLPGGLWFERGLRVWLGVECASWVCKLSLQAESAS